MDKSILEAILLVSTAIYFVGGAGYLTYHATEIAPRDRDRSENIRRNKEGYILSVFSNPLWRWTPTARFVLNSDLEFRRYVNKIENAKAAFVLSVVALFAVNVLIVRFYD